MAAFRVVAHFSDEEPTVWGEGEGDGVGDLGFGGGEGDAEVRVEREGGEGGFGGERRESWERFGGRVGEGGELEGEAGEETQAHGRRWRGGVRAATTEATAGAEPGGSGGIVREAAGAAMGRCGPCIRLWGGGRSAGVRLG